MCRPLTRHSPDVTIGPRHVDDIRAVVLLLCYPLSIVSRVQDTNRVDSLDRGSTMNDHPERSFTADARPTASRMGRLRYSTGHDFLGTALDSQQQRSRHQHIDRHEQEVGDSGHALRVDVAPRPQEESGPVRI